LIIDILIVSLVDIDLSYNMIVLLLSLLFILPIIILGNIHGGTILAMAGKDTVILATDSRFSSYQSGSLLLGEYPRRVFRIGSKVMIACFGLDSDAISLMDTLREKVGLDHMGSLDPVCVSRLVSNILYEKRLMCSPIVIGIGGGDKSTPYICTMDSLGAQTVSDSFAVTGTANAGLYAICESLYTKNLPLPKLCEVTQKCLQLALQRDILSGCKAYLYILTKDGTISIKSFDTADV